MAATAGYIVDVYITATDTNPTSSDLVANIQSLGWNESMADLDTSVLNEAFTKLLQGKVTGEFPISGIWDTADTPLVLIRTSFRARSTFYLHVAFAGTSSCEKVPVKCLSFNLSPAQDNVITFEANLKSVGAISTSTVS